MTPSEGVQRLPSSERPCDTIGSRAATRRRQQLGSQDRRREGVVARTSSLAHALHGDQCIVVERRRELVLVDRAPCPALRRPHAGQRTTRRDSPVHPRPQRRAEPLHVDERRCVNHQHPPAIARWGLMNFRAGTLVFADGEQIQLHGIAQCIHRRPAEARAHRQLRRLLVVVLHRDAEPDPVERHHLARHEIGARSPPRTSPSCTRPAAATIRSPASSPGTRRPYRAERPYAGPWSGSSPVPSRAPRVVEIKHRNTRRRRARRRGRRLQREGETEGAPREGVRHRVYGVRVTV